MERLRPLERRHPELRVRGLGLMIGIEVVGRGRRTPRPDPAAAIQRRALDEGVLVICSGPEGNVIRVLPPLVITDSELSRALDVFEACADAALGGAAPDAQRPAEQLQVERLRLGTRVNALRLAQDRAAGVVLAKRQGHPPRPGVAAHEAAVRRLVLGVALQQRLEVRDGLVEASRAEQRVRPGAARSAATARAQSSRTARPHSACGHSGQNGLP